MIKYKMAMPKRAGKKSLPPKKGSVTTVSLGTANYTIQMGGFRWEVSHLKSSSPPGNQPARMK